MKENRWGFEVGDIVKYIGHNNELEFRGEFDGKFWAEFLKDDCSGIEMGIIPTKHTGRYWDVCENETWTLVRKAKKPQREFRVGDKVKVIKVIDKGIDPKYLGKIGTINKISSGWIEFEENNICCMRAEQLELVEDEEQVCTNGYMRKLADIEIYKNSVESPTTIKKGQSIMSKLTNFVKDSFLSKEEKLMRKYGLKDSCGDYTSEARELAIQKLMSECDSYFIKVVKDMEAEEKANK